MSTCLGRPADGGELSLSACSKRCSGLRIATFFELFFRSVFHNRKTFFPLFAQFLLDLNQGIESSIALYFSCGTRWYDDCYPQGLSALGIDGGLADNAADARPCQVRSSDIPGDLNDSSLM